MKTLHIQGPYEDQLSQAIVSLLIGHESRLDITTLPSMGVLHMTRKFLENMGRDYIDLRIQMLDSSDTADYIEQNVTGHRDDAVLIVNDGTVDQYNALKGVREYTQRHIARGGKVILLLHYSDLS